MWIEKLAEGVLEIDTPIGPQYLEAATFLQRAYLVWIFRNFPSLPPQVLSRREQRFINQLWSEQRFVPRPGIVAPARPIIGRVERRVAPITELPAREPATDSRAAQEQEGEVASA